MLKRTAPNLDAARLGSDACTRLSLDRCEQPHTSLPVDFAASLNPCVRAGVASAMVFHDRKLSDDLQQSGPISERTARKNLKTGR
jgi:hypothetical protein